MRLSVLALLILLLAACQQKETQSNSSSDADTTFRLDSDAVQQYEHLALYPIVATADYIQEQAPVAQLKLLKEVIDERGFSILEGKQFGRRDDRGAVNQLTVQNKLPDDILLLAGEVFTGGKQDRVIGEDQIIAARTLQNIPVYCVEHNRWQYRDEAGQLIDDDQADRRMMAFSGYYHMAAPKVRESAVKRKNQKAVWSAVAQITRSHAAESATEAYAGLEEAEDYTQQRDAYVAALEGAFQKGDGVVGVIAVSGSQILGADLFGHPDLLRRQLSSLLHGYVTAALTDGATPDINASRLQAQLDELHYRVRTGKRVLLYDGHLVHLADF